MKTTLNNGTLTAFLSGRVDSANAPELESELGAAREANAHEAMLLDMQELEYISSAGLRVILRLRKAEPELRLVGVPAAVYEILDITGFTELLPVERAYRSVSVEGCEVIGQGANGVVYRLDKDTAVKVYRNPDSLPDVRRERELARKAFVLGIPTAIPYDVVRVNGSYGSVFELLNSRSFSKLIAAEPENIDKYVGLYVELMRKMHSTHVAPGEMPDMKEFGRDCVRYCRERLAPEPGAKLAAMVEAIPDTGTMIHGDFHTNNIVMQNDEVLLLDMDTLSVGHPIFELAYMYMGFVGFGEENPEVTVSFLGMPRETARLFWRKALRLYLGTEDEEYVRSVEERAMVLAYARMLRRSLRRRALESEAGRRSVALYERHLNELLPGLDRLDF